MAGLTNYAEKFLLDTLFASPVYAALHSGDPGEDALDNVISTTKDPNYERKVLSIGAASLGPGKAVNTTEVSWTAGTLSSSYYISHISLWSASTGGNALFKGELLSPIEMTTDTIFTITVNNLVVQLD